MSATKDLIRYLASETECPDWRERWELQVIYGKVYDAKHIETGCKVWLANSWYGVCIETPDGVRFPIGKDGSAVTAMASFFGWATWRMSFAQFAKKINRTLGVTPDPEPSAAKVMKSVGVMF